MATLLCRQKQWCATVQWVALGALQEGHLCVQMCDHD